MAEKSFKQQLKSGFFYTALAKYSGIIISLGVTAVLSRLLTPDDFGVIAIATVFIVFFSIFSDMGLSAAIIQKRSLTEKDISSLYSYTLVIGIVLAIVFFCSSWLISDIYRDKQLVPICQLLSINILFATWSIVPNGLLFRDKLFKYVGIRTLSIQFTLAVIAIVSAYCGAGVYALLINPIGSSLLLYVLSYLKRPVELTFHPEFNSVKKIASYSSYTFGFSIINYFTRNLDKLFIGKVFGMTPLGYYEKSYRLMLLPVQNLTHVITPVLHPILADLQNDVSQQADKYFKLLQLLSLVGFPLSCFLYFSAEGIVTIIFGNQWMPSVPIFKVLSLSVGLQISGSTLGAFFQATNMTKQLFWLGCINTCVNVAGLLIGIYFLKSVEGVAWMWTITAYISLWNISYIAKLVNIPMKNAFKPYISALKPTILLIVLMWGLQVSIPQYYYMRLILNGVVTFLVIAYALRLYGFFDFISYFKQIISRRSIKKS